MLRRLRAAHFARVALWIAGFLAVTGAFGLHPEPAFAAAVASGTRPLGFSTASDAPTGSDACPACLAHRPISAANLEAALTPPLPVSTDAPRPTDCSSPSAPSLSHDGRAPPSLA